MLFGTASHMLALFVTSTLSAPPNIVTFLIDDMDLERVPFYPKLDAGANWQLNVHMSGGGCRAGANCTYSAPAIEGVGAKGARFLGAHVPVSVCTPSRYSVLTGRLPSSSPFYSGTWVGRRSPQVDISWNTWIEQGARAEWLRSARGVRASRTARHALDRGCARVRAASAMKTIVRAAPMYRRPRRWPP